MSHPIVAVVNLIIKQKFRDEDLIVIQSLLRKHGKISILHVDHDDMRFYIWADKEIDYAFLEEVKNKLQELQVTNFILSADEYKRVGQKYYYADGESPDVRGV